MSNNTNMNNIIVHEMPEDHTYIEKDGICKNVKSKTNTTEQCKNAATHGHYCGFHYKNPKPFVRVLNPLLISGKRKAIDTTKHKNAGKKAKKHKKEISSCTIDFSNIDCKNACQKITKWVVFRFKMRKILRQGPATFDLSLSTNANDFFTYAPIEEIEKIHLFSFLDSNDKQIYVCDVRSIHLLIHYAKIEGNKPQNPYTRNMIHFDIVKKVYKHIDYCMRHSYSYEYEPLRPPTPEQSFRMKVVDVFTLINELNYYSTPEWFLTLDLSRQKRFYRELYELWNFRAGLTAVQKNTIVPGYSSKVFKHTIHYVNNMTTLEDIRKFNLHQIKCLISSASLEGDKSTGAMYVLTALTVVNNQAREAYPWLYESIADVGPVLPAGAPVPLNQLAQQNPGFFEALLVQLLGGPGGGIMPHLNLDGEID